MRPIHARKSINKWYQRLKNSQIEYRRAGKTLNEIYM